MRRRWPKEIPILKPGDFAHGQWSTPRKRKGSECGTRHCLVGWVGWVFCGEAFSASDIFDNAGAPAIAFLKKFCELAGESAEYIDRCDIPWFASDIFEGAVNWRTEPMTDRRGISAWRAAKIWAATMEHFGYTEDVYELAA